MKGKCYYLGCVFAFLSSVGTGSAIYAQPGLLASLSAAYAVWFGLVAICVWLGGVGHVIANTQK